MLFLIIILPLIGSLFFFHIEESSKNKFENSLSLAISNRANVRIDSNNKSLLNVINEAKKNSIIKQIGLSTSLITLILTIYLYIKMNSNLGIYQFNYNAGLPIAVDGISIYYVLLTAFITPICLLSNWRDITVKRKYFVFSFLLLETLQITFFSVVDLLLFYIYFESVLIPLFLIVGIWGASQARVRAAFLLFLYTLGGSLFMLLAILWISFNMGVTDFNFLSLWNFSVDTQGWTWFAFFLAFAVKSPLAPFHLWLFRAHAEAPLSGSILLAAVILKLATYGMLRVLLGILPMHTFHNQYIIQSLAIITLVYASLVTCRQTDLKALVAYSSVAHVAVITLGLFSNNINGIEGGILLSLAHGLVSPALFILVGGYLYSRYHTRIINYYRGLTLKMPIFSLIFFLFVIFNASAPLSLNFVGEFLALSGTFANSPLIGSIAASGIVLSALYSIFLYNRVAFLGYSPFINPLNFNYSEYKKIKEVNHINDLLSVKTLYSSNSSEIQQNLANTPDGGNNKIIGDLDRLELTLILPLLFTTVLFGLFPNTILDLLHVSVTELIYNVS
jgi:NADH-ubiquinone oxidoreductase chain 4